MKLAESPRNHYYLVLVSTLAIYAFSIINASLAQSCTNDFFCQGFKAPRAIIY